MHSRITRFGCSLVVLAALLAGQAESQWTYIAGPVGTFVRVTCFASTGTKLFAGTLSGGVYTNGATVGDVWTKVNFGLTDTTITALASSGATLFAGTGHGLFVSTNNGSSWSDASTGLTSTNISSLLVHGSDLFAGTYGGGVFLSTDLGGSWTSADSGIGSNVVTCISANDSFLYAGTSAFPSGAIYRSSDNGTTWFPATSGLASTTSIYSITQAGQYILAAIQGSGVQAVYASTDNGANWTPAGTGLPSTSGAYYVASGSNILAGTYGSGFYTTTNGGAGWSAANTGYGSTPTSALAILGAYVYAGAYDGGFWRRSLSDVLSDVKSAGGGVPENYQLAQNYPNPFNPTTTIRFAVPRSGDVVLRITNVLGEEVAELVSGYLQAGEYSIEWSAAGMPSGVYFYRLRAGDVSRTGKMSLLR
jgi:hypothetical protein